MKDRSVSEVYQADPRPSLATLKRSVLAFAEMSRPDQAAELARYRAIEATEDEVWLTGLRYLEAIHGADPVVKAEFIARLRVQVFAASARGDEDRD